MNILEMYINKNIGGKNNPGGNSSGTVIGSGDSLFSVVVQKSAEAGGFAADKTYAEILAAFEDPSTVVSFLLKINNIRYQTSDVWTQKESNVVFIFAQCNGVDRHPEMVYLCIGPDGISVSGCDVSSMTYSVRDLESTAATIPGTSQSYVTEWEYDELTSLALTTFPDEGVWRITFKSGSTPTELTLPQGLLGLDSFEPAANKKYLLDIAFGVGYAYVIENTNNT